MAQHPRWWRSWRILIGNVVLFLTVIAAFAVIARLVRNPALIDSDLPLTLSSEPRPARLGETFMLGDLSLQVEGFGWVDGRAFGDDDRLSARAAPQQGRDYLVIDLSIENRGDVVADVRYLGQGRPLDLFATARRPQPTLFNPVLPGDVATITGRAAIANGLLAPGEVVRGPLVFALEPSRRRLGLLLVSNEAGVAPVEVALSDRR